MQSTKNRFHKLTAAGSAKNTVLSYENDIKYFWGWAKIAKRRRPEYPVPASLVETFVLDHIEGLKPAINKKMVKAGIKRIGGKHTVSTIDRRVKAIIWKHKLLNLEVNFWTQEVKTAIAAAKRISSKAGRIERKSRAIIKPLVLKMGETFSDSIIDKRDKAILYFGFFTGGRRRLFA